MTTNNESETTEVTEIKDEVAEVPNTAPRGFEAGIDQEDIKPPYASLLQALSPEIVEGVEGLKSGMVIHSITKAVLPEEFIPFFFYKSYVCYNPREKENTNFNKDYEPGAVIWQANTKPTDPEKLKQLEWGPNGEKPSATKYLNFLSYFPGINEPVIVGFCKSSYSAGSKFASLIKYTGQDMFARKYKLGSKIENNDKGTYAVFQVEPVGFSSEEEFKKAEEFWKAFSDIHDQAKLTIEEDRGY